MSSLSQRTLSILDTALSMVRNIGFESVSINSLAKEVGMSKSGLFAHFNSKEKMHIMILDHAANSFGEDVFRKSFSAQRGLPRLKRILKNWQAWYSKDGGGTCPFMAAAIEYDTKDGEVKERLLFHTNQLIDSLHISIQHCIDEQHFSQEIDPQKVAYELYSLTIGHLIYLRTMQRRSAKKLFQEASNELIERCLNN